MYRTVNTNNHRIPVLMYHEVTNIPERPKKIRRIDPQYSIISQKFEEQMLYLFEHGYETISPDTLTHHQKDSNQKCVITFDDGLIGNFTTAYPILSKYQFKATIFVFVEDIRRQLASTSGTDISQQADLSIQNLISSMATAAQNSILEGCPVLIERRRAIVLNISLQIPEQLVCPVRVTTQCMTVSDIAP